MGENPTGSARRKALGAYGEDLACAYLTERGFRIVMRNWRCADGELDIVAMDGVCLVGCEVKTRASARFGLPEEAVTAVKLRRLRRLLTHWLTQETVGAVRPLTIRLDVVAVVVPKRGAVQVRHLMGVG